VRSISYPPIDATDVARFADAMGDDNPLHRVQPGGRSPAPVLPGALLAFLAESAISELRQEQRLVHLNLLFTRPVKAAAAISFRLRDGHRIRLEGDVAGSRARLVGAVDGQICLIADCILLPDDVRQSGNCAG